MLLAGYLSQIRLNALRVPVIYYWAEDSMVFSALDLKEPAALRAQSADGRTVGPAMVFPDCPDEDPMGLPAVVPAAAGLKGYEDPPVYAAGDPEEHQVVDSSARWIAEKKEMSEQEKRRR
jgi:hypothetical protein